MHTPEPHSCLIQNARDTWWSFNQPLAVLTTRRVDEVSPLLDRLMMLVDGQGLWAAGFIAYEAAAAFDAHLPVHAPGSTPLLWFGVYQTPTVCVTPTVYLTPTASQWSTTLDGVDLAAAARAAHVQSAELPEHWQPSLSAAQYAEKIVAIRQFLDAGDNYQTNFTMRMEAQGNVDPWALFLRMVGRADTSRYGAYIDGGEFVVASASPELLLQLDGEDLRCRPMKGTAPRGRWPDEDQMQAKALRNSIKNRAENLMITDMVRNDLSRIARLGSVHTPELFALERYPALWTLTSEVRAKTNASIPDILRALFPAASITGAPKRRTMQIIHELEAAPRGVYTGSIGYLGPHRQAQFNVAIRTAVVDRAQGRVTYGVGGGVVWDSTSDSEYAECLLKAEVVTGQSAAFELLETLLWHEPRGFVLLERHLARLQASADYFAMPCDVARARTTLDEAVAGKHGAWRVRLLVAATGIMRCETTALVPGDADWSVNALPRIAGIDQPLTLALSDAPVDARDVFLFHKTTHRRVYETALAKAQLRLPNCADVLLYNSRNEVTETTAANLVVERAGALLTPALGCGLLAGTLRAELLARGVVREAVLSLADVREDGNQLWLINSVRGWRRVRLM